LRKENIKRKVDIKIKGEIEVKILRKDQHRLLVLWEERTHAEILSSYKARWA